MNHSQHSPLLLVCLLQLAGFPATQAALYPRIEASFNLPGIATDPFDYTVTDVRAQIVSPDGATNTYLCFFDGGTTWRVRHAPSTPGVYSVAGVLLNGAAVSPSNLQPASWTVVGWPVSPGYVGIDPLNTNRFVTGDGRRHFPLGHNVAWDTSATVSVVNLFAKMGASHENWARVWMDHWDGKNLDWPKVGSSFGTLSLTVAQKWDAIVRAAEQSGISFQMTLQHHGQYSTTTDSNWADNPYNVARGGFLTNASQFLTNDFAKALTKRKLRYAVARWGYSPAIMAWELFNEVQFTEAAQGGQWNLVGAWHDEMARFIRSQDIYHHLVTTSSQLDQPIWNECDYYQHHDYPSDLISALSDPPGCPAGQPVKAIFGGENGMDSTAYYGFHAPLWAGLMGGQSGASQQWYWDHVDADNAYNLFRAGRDFVLAAGFAEQDAVTRSAPHVTCPVNGSLSFSPGGGWANATQTSFTVGDSAPAGIGTLPSYLQGSYHKVAMGMPNGYTFLVNYSVPGTFSVQVVQIALSGASLVITVDNTTTNRIDWPNMGSDTTTNYTLTVNVPAGQHTIRLTNPGLDWVLLGLITLNPYAPILGAYQVGNTNFAALWVYHRTNIYNPSATTAVSGTVPLAGLSPGTYLGAWWDTFAGMVTTNFSFTVTGADPITLSLPAVLRSAAFYVGPPPQAALGVPALTQTLASNSPPVVLPLSLTNTGGLPLAYSLCITGASPVAYAATTSQQPGGPQFRWTDISSVGRDLTSSLTALTAKTAGDEGIAGPIPIGFNFPFFSGAQNPGVFFQVYISPNGFLTFSPFAGDTALNRNLPSSLGPSNLVACFWDDLDLATAGRIYCATDSVAGTFTVQWQNATIKGTSANVTCQAILKTTGEILFQYKSVGISNQCTVGVQNAAATQGLQAAFNQAYLQSGFAVSLTPTPWLSLSAGAGLVPKGATETLNLAFNPAGLASGSYAATLLLSTADPAAALTVLPVTLQVVGSPIEQWRLAHFGTTANAGIAADSADPDGDGLVNLLEYAFNTDPNVANASPLSWALAGNHLVLTFKRAHPVPPDITYLFEVTDDLAVGTWQSGPAFTSLASLDNGDGTETVRVTDNSDVTVSARHFIRVRISRP